MEKIKESQIIDEATAYADKHTAITDSSEWGNRFTAFLQGAVWMKDKLNNDNTITIVIKQEKPFEVHHLKGDLH